MESAKKKRKVIDLKKKHLFHNCRLAVTVDLNLSLRSVGKDRVGFMMLLPNWFSNLLGEIFSLKLITLQHIKF